MSYREICVAAALCLGGLSPVWGQNSQLNYESSSRDLWQPRNRTSESRTLPGEAERGWNEAASSSASPSGIKWKSSDQLPASPWDQPSRGQQPLAQNLQTRSNYAPAGQGMPPMQVASPHPNNMIRQPSSSLQSSTEIASNRPTHQPTGYPIATHQPERPFTPIPRPTNVNTEVPFTEAEYVSNAPSSVVGVVVGNGMESNYASSIEDRPLENFQPEQPSYEAMLVSGPMLVSPSKNESEAIEARKKLAGRVSADILHDDHHVIVEAPRAIEAPAGWKSIEEDLRIRLDRCDELLRRNAILSARDEILSALRTLIRAIDLRSGVWAGEPALDRALTAFEEDADFHDSIRNPTRGASTADIVNRHTTPVLKNTDLNNVSPELASQHYRNFARQQLNLAGQQHPWASDLFYALGRTFERNADACSDENSHWRNQAIVCYEAALTITPTHAGGSNQLGYALLKLDRIDEAHAALNHSIQSKPTADAWRNIAEIYRRRGQTSQATYASNQVASLEAAKPASNIPEVVSLDPQAFAGISPNQFVGQASATQVVAPAAQSAPPATTKAGWFGKLWR